MISRDLLRYPARFQSFFVCTMPSGKSSCSLSVRVEFYMGARTRSNFPEAEGTTGIQGHQTRVIRLDEDRNEYIFHLQVTKMC